MKKEEKYKKTRLWKLFSFVCTVACAIGMMFQNVYAATTTVLTLEQKYTAAYSSVSATSKEEYVNSIDGINYISISMKNAEVQWECPTCGSLRASSTGTVVIYGYTKSNEAQEELGRYTVSGTDGNSPRSRSYQMMLTESMKDKYKYLKIHADFTGATAGSCSHSNAYGYYSYGNGLISISCATYDSPTIKSTGNLTDKYLVEGVSDYIGNINAYFPTGQEVYAWQYYDGENWKNITDGTSIYESTSKGTLKFLDKNGGTDFSKSNSLKLDNPKIENSGMKLRAILGTGTNTVTTETAVITVNSKDIEDFDSIRFANRYGQVGDSITIDDIISFVRFNNGQVVESDKLSKDDNRCLYYGFIGINDDISGMTDSEVIEGLSSNNLDYEDISNNKDKRKIVNGSNKFFVKLTYNGTKNRSIYGSVKFEGKDSVPPQFDENVELYESDGMTIYTGKDYEISDKNPNRKLKIRGTITDTVNDAFDISWAYTLTDTTDASHVIDIPVYRVGNEININADYNGTYALYAEDKAGNKTSKTIKVKAYDENDPTIKVAAYPSGKGEGNVCNGYTIEVTAADVEGLSKKPYLYKCFATEKEAQEYNCILADASEYVSANTFTVKQDGYYAVFVKDAVGKYAGEIIKIPNSGYVMDTCNPEISIEPVSIKDSEGELSEYIISVVDNNAINKFEIRDSKGQITISSNHNHADECKADCCIFTYHFKPDTEGKYSIKATDMAGNETVANVTVSMRTVEAIEVTDLPDSMSVNSEVNVKGLIEGNRILLKMSDGTTDVYSDNKGILLECTDSNGNKVDKLLIGYGENTIHFRVTVNKNKENEKTFEFSKTIIGEDNVAPLPGEFQTSFSEGWDGSLTNDVSKQVTLRAAGYEDDGSQKENLIITWYKDDVEVQKKTAKEGGDSYGPFSGEEANGTYRYSVTDEKGNFCNSTFKKNIDCWDTTPPQGEVRLLPEGVDEASKARYKQIQIVNASDDRALAEKPYSFKGNNEDAYSIVGSVVAGENGSYEIYIRDACGNVTHLRDMTLSGIDSIAPTINGYEINTNDEGKTILHVDASDTDSDGNDNSGTLKYSIDGENYKDEPDFEIDESGVYTIYVKDDTGNITRTSTDYTDTDKPVVAAHQDESGAGVIIVDASDNVGLSRIVMEGPDGSREILQVYDGAASDTVRKEIGKIGTYTITATDMSGNASSVQVNVESISAACNPSILSGLRITPQEWTSGDVTVIAQLVDTTGLSSSPFRWNGNVPTAKPYVIMTENGTATVEICDRYGNSIVSDSITVTNIDRTSPIMEELKQSEDKNHVEVNVSDTGSGVAQITISGGPYSVEMSAVKLSGEKNPDSILITLPTNGTYTIRAYDCAGNSCQRQIVAEGVTTDVAKVVTEVVTEEKIVTVDNVITEERVVTQDRIVTQNVETPVPVLVPVPTTEYITKYKYLREEGEDTTTYIRGDDIYNKSEETIKDNTETVTDKETTVKDADTAFSEKKDAGLVGERTADGTYIGPDGYEYFGRVEKGLKESNPLKYWFKKNAEKIAALMCVISLILLIICIFMGVLLTKDYFKEQHDKDLMKKLSKKQ